MNCRYDLENEESLTMEESVRAQTVVGDLNNKSSTEVVWTSSDTFHTDTVNAIRDTATVRIGHFEARCGTDASTSCNTCIDVV